MRKSTKRRAIALVAALLMPGAALALDAFSFSVSGGDADLTATLRSASLVASAEASGTTDAHDLLAAALADYARLTEALYAEGRYGGVVHIRLDGREAANVPTWSVPDNFRSVKVTVDPGPVFRFSRATVAPLPMGTVLPEGFRVGAVAPSPVIREAVSTGIGAWRDAGHAKADVGGQQLVADHATRTIAADVTLAPGPLVRFGDLTIQTPSAVRAERLARIAGLPRGQVFSPGTLDTVAERLRRTGAFAAVSLTEADALGPGDTMDIGLAVVDKKPRRFGFGAELSSLEGLALNGYWMHRNLFGGAERPRIEGEVHGITGKFSGMDYGVTARLDVPAAFGTDHDAFAEATVHWFDDPAYRLMTGEVNAGTHIYFFDKLEGQVALSYIYAMARTGLGKATYSLVSLPAELTWDGRDDKLDPGHGLYLHGEAKPFYAFSSGGTGARFWADLRGYLRPGDGPFTFAARGLVGYLAGTSANDVPPNWLFYSGGGDTVRGFAYQSLGVDIGGGNIIGGRAFVGLSGEARYKVTDTIGVVAFADYGMVGKNGFFDPGGDWQLGAGIGGRYYTAIGPVRLDLALPVRKPGGGGVSLTWPKVYVGLGQAF